MAMHAKLLTQICTDRSESLGSATMNIIIGTGSIKYSTCHHTLKMSPYAKHAIDNTLDNSHTHTH